VLTISGKKESSKEEEGVRYYLKESRYGSFSRSVRLPGEVSEEDIEANYKDGILTLVLRQAKEPKTKKIQIKPEMPVEHNRHPTRLLVIGPGREYRGLGGEGILRTHDQDNRAVAVIEEAIDSGICYFDCARAYAGSEGYYGLVWPKRPSDRSRIFQTSKSAMRDKAGALVDLDRTLTTMGIDHLDLWQIHDVRTEEDLNTIAGPRGALEAFMEAKATGKVRFIGVTGHHDPFILTRAVREWPVDALMPVNLVEVILGFR
jgi:hypothetical protein